METAVQFFENAFLVIEVIVIALTFHLILSAPWLLVVWLTARGTRDLLAPRQRFVLLSGIAAAGLAPAFGHHGSFFPMYWGFWNIFAISAPEALSALVSFIITWSLFLLVGYGVAKYRVSAN